LAIDQLNTSWPPEYKIVVSKKAKYLRLEITNYGLKVVLPKYFPLHAAEKFIAKKRHWIEKRLPRHGQQAANVLPTTLELKAINQTWKVLYFQEDTKKIWLQANANNELIIRGKIERRNDCCYAINVWLKQMAKIHLLPILEYHSAANSLPFNRASVGCARTRWGSCTNKKHIRLNCWLLLLDPELVKYVVIHELCHLKHPNHSKTFWQALTKYLPDCLNLRQRLKAIRIGALS
jgi:predicted metal-dependent hydrolase